MGESASADEPQRMLAWTAYLDIDVWNVSNACVEAIAFTEDCGGYVEERTDYETSTELRLRIPGDRLHEGMAFFEELGEVTHRNVGSEDVTEEYIDVDAKLKNLVVLRDRLRTLLDKATEVKDILAIETELNRVQGEIDSLEGRIKALRGRVDYATINLDLNRSEILGPLGFVSKWTWWGIEKLFYIRY
jgi:hypothetical protein